MKNAGWVQYDQKEYSEQQEQNIGTDKKATRIKFHESIQKSSRIEKEIVNSKSGGNNSSTALARAVNFVVYQPKRRPIMSKDMQVSERKHIS